MTLVEEAREAFRPDQVKTLFIAEAPPCASDRFFYFPDVYKGDSLFLHIIREVFTELKNVETKQVRAMKEELLLRFREEGYFLEDSSLTPIPKDTSPSHKAKLLTAEQDNLHRRIERYKKSSTVVLLSAPVFKTNYTYLKQLGYRILNTTAIPFPGSGQQNKFKKAIADIEL